MKNIESTSELLAISETDHVRQWNEATVKRAFQWSNYCEQIFKRFNANTSFRTAIENQLRVTNDHLRKTFLEHKDVTFTDLGRCRDVLMVRLLQNLACPHSVVNALFGSFCKPSPDSGDAQASLALGFPALQGSLLRKSAGELLWTSDINLGPTCGGLCMKALVNGSILGEHIQKLLTHTGSDNLAERLLDSLSQSDTEDSCPEIIAGALLSCGDSASSDVARNTIFTWLESHPNTLCRMCQLLPMLTLTILAQQSERFQMAYMDILKQWATYLTYDVTEGEWVTSEDNSVPFSTLTKHFRSLTTSGHHQLETFIFRQLHELKENDGGFEERGLSVFGDILSQLNTRPIQCPTGVS